MADNAEMQYRYGRMNTGDLILECERLRGALEKILYIRTISRLEPMTLDDAIKVAQDALTAAIGTT